MSKILELKQRRADIAATVQTLAMQESGGTALSAEQLQQLDALKAEFDQLGAQLARLEDAERMIAAAAQQVDTLNAQGAPPAGGVYRASANDLEVLRVAAGLPARPYATPAQPTVKGASVARMAVALIHAQGNYRMAADYADKNGFGADVAAALNGGSPSAGGVLIPANMATEIIELLRPKAVVRRLGARSLPLKNGNLAIPRLKGGASVGYIGADNDIPATEQSFDDLKLSAKKMAALVPISNDLLDNAGISPDVEQVVVGDLTSAVAAREDLAFLRGDGSNNTPKGLRGWALPGNCIAAPAPATVDAAFLQAVEDFLNALILLLEGVDANMVSPGWVMSPRTFRFLEGLRDGKSNKVYPELAQGMLKGYPVGKSTQIPNNLGAGGNESELYFCDFADCFIGEDKALTIDFSKEATYTGADGKLVSAFSKDQTLVRVIAKHDFGPRHVESVAIGTGVKWGK